MADALTRRLNWEKDSAFDLESLYPAIDLYLTSFACKVNCNQEDILQDLQDSVRICDHL